MFHAPFGLQTPDEVPIRKEALDSDKMIGSC